MKGSWAGAMGQTQFMPSSYLKHARGFRRRRRSRHLALHARRARLDCQLPEGVRLEGGRDLGPRGAAAGGQGRRHRRAGRACGTTGCRAEREMTSAPAACGLAEGWASGRSRGAPCPRVDRDGVAAAGREESVSRLRQLRGAPRLQLRPRLRAGRGPVGRSHPPLVQSADVASPEKPTRGSGRSRARIGAVRCRWPRRVFRRPGPAAARHGRRWLFVLLGGLTFELARRRSL